ncbi:MAG: diguanylate cyclase [Solirubrobacterales bacterium]|nr:diguanylate cyclase [Solirubrobacterales bacterium]
MPDGRSWHSGLDRYRISLRRSSRVFVGVTLILFLVALIGVDSEDFRWQYYLGGWAVGLVSLYVAWLKPSLWLLAPFGALASILLIRAGTGDLESGIGPLLLVPIFAVSAYGSRRSLVIMLAVVGVVALLTRILVVDNEALKPIWMYDFTLLVVGGALAFAVQDLVERVRRSQSLADARSQNIATLSEMTRRMATSPDGASTLCSLILEETDALGASIIEFDPDRGWRAITGMGAGTNGSSVATAGAEEQPWNQLEKGSRWEITDSDPEFEQHVSDWANREIETIIWQPIVDRGQVAGAIAIAWGETGQRIDQAPLPLEALAAEALVAVQQFRLNEQLNTQARTDPLTGIDNRRAWEAEVGRSLARARRTRGPLAIALLDLDRFKEFNDSHGHPEGDQLLQETVAAWKKLLRTEDHLARYGGDEFMLTLPDTDVDRANIAVDRLRTAVPRGQSCSAGIACLKPGDGLSDLVKRADDALYRDKSRNRPG